VGIALAVTAQDRARFSPRHRRALRDRGLHLRAAMSHPCQCDFSSARTPDETDCSQCSMWQGATTTGAELRHFCRKY